MKKSVQVFLTCMLFSFCSFASADLTNIKAKAVQIKLWQDSYWHKLLHYEKRNFGGYKSQVDAQNFFLSPDGKSDPQGELLKNIEVLFESHEPDQDLNEQPVCKFPLRYKWLREKLQIDSPSLDELKCTELQTWETTLGANGISMIFASSYTNNPASMFGHTFLRLHRVKNGVEMPDILHYTINFAADTGTEGGMLYTLKGLFGFYPGIFSTFPYYVKIRQYNHFESRDLWEYKLDIPPDQLEKIILHLWEMGSAYFDYYFGDENCSYFLLSLLEMTDVDIQLRKHLPFFTIPIDTLKIIKNDTHWIMSTYYRPSLGKRFEEAFKKFNPKEKQVFNSVVEKKKLDDLSSIPQESLAKVIDAAIDFLSMKEKTETKTEFQKKLLDVRSENPVPYETPAIIQPADPLSSHPTSRFGLGGSRIAGENFVHFDFRGVYHDLLDDPAGFDPAAQIQSMEGRIRVSLDNGDVDLDHLKLIEVVSLNPIKKYLAKPAWNVGFGWRKNFSDECFDCGSFYLEGGPGITLGNTSSDRRIYFTTFGNLFFQAGPWNDTNYQVGPSATSSLLMDVVKQFHMMLSGNVRYSPLGEPNFIYKAGLEGSLDLYKNVSIRGWGNQYSQSREFGGSLYFYF